MKVLALTSTYALAITRYHYFLSGEAFVLENRHPLAIDRVNRRVAFLDPQELEGEGLSPQDHIV